MKLTKYTIELDKNQINVLVKESSTNYPEVSCLNRPSSVVQVMNYLFHANKKAEEYLWVIAVNTKLKPIGFFELSHGTINSSLVTPRELFIRLALCGASGFFLVHNHPSGDCSPSKEDGQVTKRIKEAAKIMGYDFLDHIIIGGDSFYSFKEN